MKSQMVSVCTRLTGGFHISKAVSLFLFVAALSALVSCSGDRNVREYFRDHGMSYPVDVSGVSLWRIEYAGIADDEMSGPEVRAYVEGGLAFMKEYFRSNDVDSLVPGAAAVVVNKPVLYRNESGDVGLMVRMTAYGTGEPDGKIRASAELLGSGTKLWRVENYAYFFRNDLYRWQYGGLVR